MNGSLSALTETLSAVPGLEARGDGSLSFRGVRVAKAVRCGSGILLDVRAHPLDAPQLVEVYGFCRLLAAGDRGEEGWIRATLHPNGGEEALEAVREAVASAEDRVREETGEENGMDKYVCDVCGWVYDPAKGDPDSGVEPGTKFEDLPDDWTCPVCGAGKDDFSKQ